MGFRAWEFGLEFRMVQGSVGFRAFGSGLV